MEAKETAEKIGMAPRTLFERLREHVARCGIARKGHGAYYKVQK